MLIQNYNSIHINLNSLVHKEAKNSVRFTIFGSYCIKAKSNFSWRRRFDSCTFGLLLEFCSAS